MMKKSVVGAATVGVVWSAPRIEGLSLRPNYAAAQSGSPTFTATFNQLAAAAIVEPAGGVCGGGTWAPGPTSASPGGFVGIQTNTTAGATLTINGVSGSPMPNFFLASTTNNPGAGGDFFAFNAGAITIPTTFTVTYDCTSAVVD